MNINKTEAPTSQPSFFPSTNPTALPSVIPTISPTTFPTSQPTISPTPEPGNSSSSSQYEMIDADDITITIERIGNINDEGVIEDNVFNIGFRNEFYAAIAVKLDSSKKVNLFTSDNQTVNITANWKVIRNNGSTGSTIANQDLTNILVNSSISLEYSEYKLVMNQSNINNSRYLIDSYFVLYQSVAVSKYSSLICDSVSDLNEFFEFGAEYTFEIELTAQWNSNIVTSSSNITLKANKPAVNGTCVVSPDSSGGVLTDRFNFSCYDWEDADGSNRSTVLTYNFLWENRGLFLKSQYDGIPFIDSIFSVGNQTVQAVILDEYSYPTCVNIDIMVSDDNIEQFSNDSVSNFTDWLTRTYFDIYDELEEIEYSDGFNDSINETFIIESQLRQEIVILTEVVYQVAQTYVENTGLNLNTTGNQLLIEGGLIVLQQELIDTLIEVYTNISGTGLNSTFITTFLSVLSSVTNPLINDDLLSLGDIEDNFALYNGIYDQDTAASVLEIVTDILDTYTEHIENTNGNMTGNFEIDSDSAQNIFNILDNILILRKYSNETDGIAMINGQSMIDITNSLSYSMLYDSIPGELYHFISDNGNLNAQLTKISFTTYSSEEHICASEVTDTMILSNQLIADLSNNGANFLDCTVMSVFDNYDEDMYIKSDNNYAYDIYANLEKIISDSKNNTFQTNFLMIEITPSTTTSTSQSYASESSRRLLRSTYLDSCEPILFTLEAVNQSIYNYGLCIFYNETTNVYEDSGCWVYSSTDSTVTCGCRHTTLFGASWTEFEPETDWKKKDVYLAINFENLKTHPLGFIVVTSWILVGIFIMVFGEKLPICQKEDKPLIAQKDAVFTHATAIKQDRSQYRVIQEMRVIRDDTLKHKNCCVKSYHLWTIGMKNDHVIFGLCFRQRGTSYTHKQRVSVLLARFLSTCAVSAIFFGVSKDTIFGDISLAFWEAAVGWLPMVIMTQLIKRHKPKERETEDLAIKRLRSESINNRDGRSSSLHLKKMKTKNILEVLHTNQTQRSNGEVYNDAEDMLNIYGGTIATGDGDGRENGKADEQDAMGGDANEQEKEKQLHVKRMELIEEMRLRLLHKRFKYPYWCKYVTLCLISMWIIGCAIVTTIFCVWFDVELKMQNEYQQDIDASQCNDTYYDIPETVWLDYNATQTDINNILSQYVGYGGDIEYTPYNPQNENDSFGDDVSISMRFILTCILSYIFSLFFFAPIKLYIKSLYRLLKYVRKPNKINEALLFYDNKYLMNIELEEKQ